MGDLPACVDWTDQQRAGKLAAELGAALEELEACPGTGEGTWEGTWEGTGEGTWLQTLPK